MPFFSPFSPAEFHDPHLGVLVRSGGYWEGDCSLPPRGVLKLKLSGGRKSPDPTSIDLAHELPRRFSDLMKPIEESLFDHYQPYRDAVVTGDLPLNSRPLADISAARDVWRHVTVLGVLIEPLQGVPTIEISFDVAWDEEHTLGARIQHWKLLEICGSV
jgi:hypothetical protein